MAVLFQGFSAGVRQQYALEMTRLMALSIGEASINGPASCARRRSRPRLGVGFVLSRMSRMFHARVSRETSPP